MTIFSYFDVICRDVLLTTNLKIRVKSRKLVRGLNFITAGLALYNLMIQLFLIRGWISTTSKDESVLPALARPGITTTVHQDIASVVGIETLESELCQGHYSIKYVHVVRTKSDKTGY